MLVNQKTHNLYSFITATLTLAHLKRTKAPGIKSSTKGPK